MKPTSTEDQQRELCFRLGAEYTPPNERSVLGISLNVRTGIVPVNGLRHPPRDNASGWYIWAGETLEDREDLFVPLHFMHVKDWRDEIQKFLALPAGWRFLIAGRHEDIWFDPALLDV